MLRLRKSLKKIVCANRKVAECRIEINKKIRAACVPSKNCFLADLENLVGKLQKTQMVPAQKVKLTDGREYSYDEIRVLSMVNVSPVGSQAAVEDVLQHIQAAIPNPQDLYTRGLCQ